MSVEDATAHNVDTEYLQILANAISTWERQLKENTDPDACDRPGCQICIKREPGTVEFQNYQLYRKYLNGKWTPDDEFWNILGV